MTTSRRPDDIAAQRGALERELTRTYGRIRLAVMGCDWEGGRPDVHAVL